MKSLLFLFSLLLVQLVESGPGTVKPRQTLILTCSVLGVSITSSSYTWNWIRQLPGKGLEWVASIYPYDGRKWFALSLQNQVTISLDSFKNQFSLQLASLTGAETTMYYCAREAENCRAEQGLIQKEEVDCLESSGPLTLKSLLEAG
uniref:Immunoglobulin V-set domain-containing protein n=1 Tax=Pelusios castaneus TaxID=367368 RepID=A0A8C8RNZ6_9SAUR